MQRLGIVLGTLLLAAPLAAQDTTKQAAPAKPAAPAPAAAAAPAAGGASLALDEAVIAKSVVDRAPQDSGTTFPADVAQLICYTKVTGGGPGGGSLHHVWFHGDTQVADVELTVGGSPWRTWSRKTIPADWTGAWHVEVRDASGTVLKRLDFTVGQ